MTWPTLEQTRNLTVLVFVISGAVGLFIAVFDALFNAALQGGRADLMAETEATAVRAPEKRWYVIHTYSGYEKKVKTNLEHRIESMGVQDKIFQVVIPDRGGDRDQGRASAARSRRRSTPVYVMVEMAMDEPTAWYVVRNTPGVATRFVGQITKNHPEAPFAAPG